MNETLMPLYIFDLDGTLALIDHRRELVQGEKTDWKAFFAACTRDAPNLPVINTMDNILRSGCEVQIFSGRSDEVLDETIQWLAEHTPLIPYEVKSLTPARVGFYYRDRSFNNLQHTLRMRKAGDYTPDYVLKKKWLDEMSVAEFRRLVAVFDDRDPVVKMWRDAGVACFQVAPGDF